MSDEQSGKRPHSLKDARRSPGQEPPPDARKPMTFNDGEVQRAVGLIKKERPDLWERFVEHERRDEGYEDIATDLRNLLRQHYSPINSVDLLQLAFQVRREARRESGRPI